MIAAELLLLLAPPQTEVLYGDKGYDGDKVRRQIEAQGAAPSIPPKSNRKYKPGFSPALYKNRNPIERPFCRIKDFRRIATRYDKLSRNYLAAVQLTATVCFWLLA
jgi:transposase